MIDGRTLSSAGKTSRMWHPSVKKPSHRLIYSKYFSFSNSSFLLWLCDKLWNLFHFYLLLPCILKKKKKKKTKLFVWLFSCRNLWHRSMTCVHGWPKKAARFKTNLTETWPIWNASCRCRSTKSSNWNFALTKANCDPSIRSYSWMIQS